jgi:hypothetical protein
MSGEQIVGHVSWSPDFKADKNGNVWLQKALDAGTVKLAPRWSGDKLVSVDLVKSEPEGPIVQEEDQSHLRPHQAISNVLLIGPGTESPEISFTYKNWKDEVNERRAVLSSLWWGSNEWHPEPQLLVNGYDLDKKAPRIYAVKDISDIKIL